MTGNDTAASGTTPPQAAATLTRSVEFMRQAARLSHQNVDDENLDIALEAKFITPMDPVIVTSNGHRLPGVPVEEAHKLNVLRENLESYQSAHVDAHEYEYDETQHLMTEAHDQDGSLRRQMPPSHTNPLFPPLPLYGPPSILRDLQCITFRASSFFLSMGFLGVIVLGSLFTSIPTLVRGAWLRLTFRNPDINRPFHQEERRRAAARKEMERNWKRRSSSERFPTDNERPVENDGYVPTEGGPDPIVCDVGYYARRCGLDVEEFEVQTEDGFIIDLWHVYDPREYEDTDPKGLAPRGPDLFTGETRPGKKLKDPNAPRKYPVLLIHGLLQSAGAYCVNDEQSLAFWLCKAGYDVWLGNNRCGFKPKHTLLNYQDPRMWCWNIRHMGVHDLPALTSRVLYETGFSKIGLVAHSQGTTQTFVALAKEQRPELGEKLSVFCALAPAAYAGPLIGKMYFKFMRVITPAMFRMMFGIHAFIPIMMTMHKLMNPRIYGWLGYKVFSFLFDWSDNRWDRGLRDRMFQFAPVYVSAESMRWWLGRECFANHKCILATKEEWRAEELEDATEGDGLLAKPPPGAYGSPSTSQPDGHHHRHHHRRPKGSTAWYNTQSPPFALWVCGRDNLVDGSKILRRFERGREPHARLVHKKVIPEYEHLDVIWAMDAEEEVFREVRDVLWRTTSASDRAKCRVPRGCEDVEIWIDDRRERESSDNMRGGEPELARGSSTSRSSSSSGLSTVS